MPKDRKISTWLLFVYKVPSHPARNRAYVWRKLNRLHALYIQQAVCLLPDSERNMAELMDLSRWVKEVQGEATLLQVLGKDPAWEREIEARFQLLWESKYRKIQEEIRKFVAEIRLEERRKRYNSDEVEELEEKFDSLQRWSNKLCRDLPENSSLHSRTRAELRKAGRLLDRFSRKVEELEEKAQARKIGWSRGKLG